MATKALLSDLGQDPLTSIREEAEKEPMTEKTLSLKYKLIEKHDFKLKR